MIDDDELILLVLCGHPTHLPSVICAIGACVWSLMLYSNFALELFITYLMLFRYSSSCRG